MGIGRRRIDLGREFAWLWSSYVVSSLGTGLAFGAFSIVAITVLKATSAQVSMLAGAGLVVGALLAVPLGPWMEARRKRPVMFATGIVRFIALASIPVAYTVGGLTFTQLLVVSIITAAAKIAFTSASGAYLRCLVPAERLVAANSRFETVNWSTTIIGPPAGGMLIGLFGPVITIAVDAVSYLLSAVGIACIRTTEDLPAVRPRPSNRRSVEVIEGWRYILATPGMRALFVNSLLVNGLIMAAEPPLAALMLGHLGFSTWQYGLAFAIPCIGGLVGSRVAPTVVNRLGESWVLRRIGTLRACWPIGLAFVQPGWAGLAIVMVTEIGLIVSCSVFNPVLATYRLTRTDVTRQTRVLAAWSVSSAVSIAALTLLWGVVAHLMGARGAVAAAGMVILMTPILLTRTVFRNDSPLRPSVRAAVPR